MSRKPSAPARSASLSDFVQRQWQSDGWWATLLRPLAALTGWHVHQRRTQYATGKREVYRAPVPVIVVGNIYVGGTGKTPVVIATVQALRERGWTPGVVSRGYGARIGPRPLVGKGDLKASEFGDEPALIAHATEAPIAVHPLRVRAVQALLHQYPKVNVIVSDDGLQHLALARDAELVVQDERGVGNGRLLPAGPLREPASRLNAVDVVITNRSATPSTTDATAAVVADHRPSPQRVDMRLQPTAARQVTSGTQRPLSDFAQATHFPAVAAAAGIGNPARFFATLSAAGIRPDTCLSLPDHFDYQQSPFETVAADAILITAKDAIKCRHLQDARLWEVPVDAQFSDPTLFDWLDQHLRQIANGL